VENDAEYQSEEEGALVMGSRATLGVGELVLLLSVVCHPLVSTSVLPVG
jgi:hypothetical protein